jgi:nucleoid-associated protein YgaU
VDDRFGGLLEDRAAVRRRPRPRGKRRVRLLSAGAGVAAALGIALAVHGGASGTPAQVTVHRGDTLWAIAGAHYPGDAPQAAVARIEAANHLAGPVLRPGQVLTLPAP